MDKVRGFLKIWGRALLSLAGLGVAVLVFKLLAPGGLTFFAVMFALGSTVMLVLSVYGGFAELYYKHLRKEVEGNISYKKELRKLERARRKALNDLFFMKGYTSSRRSNYKDVLEIERKIAEHKGLEYEEPVKTLESW